MQDQLQGVFAPVITPFDREDHPDAHRFVKLCRWLLSRNAGLAMFGTNSEANSLSLVERRGLLDAALAAGLAPGRMLPGTGACAIPEAVELTRHAVDAGCAGALMLPPFYYKGVGDDGLFEYYARVIDRVASERLRVCLNHIPQLSGVPISHALIERLLARYPGTVVGIKDSAGDGANVEAMLARFPGFAVFPASEAMLARALPLGAAGCISATANIQPGAIAEHIARWRELGMEQRHRRVEAVRLAMQAYPMIPALKAVIAHCLGDAAWRRVRPPLELLSDTAERGVTAALAALDFTMPGLADA